jgi:hypothetical protein
MKTTMALPGEFAICEKLRALPLKCLPLGVRGFLEFWERSCFAALSKTKLLVD